MSDRTKKILLPIVIIGFGIIAMVVLLNAYPDAERVKTEPYKPLVRYEVAKKGSSKIYVNSQGTVKPRTESLLFSLVSGQIISISPKFASGGFFKKGEVILSIDPTDFRLAKTRAELQVAQAELVLAREQEEAKLARDEWKKIAEGEAPPLVLREPQVKQAKASLAAAKAALEQAALNLDRTQVKAPYDCRIKRKRVDIGQLAGPNAAIADIYAGDYAEIRLPLTDGDLSFIDIPYAYRAGQKRNEPGVVISNVFAGKTYKWEGRLVRLEGEIDPVNRMMHGIARIDDPFQAMADRPPLSVGMFITAEIEGRTYDNVYTLSRAALRGENMVWVINGQDELNFRTVDVLRTERDQVIITSGIEENEKICLTVLDAVVDGMKVKIEE
jgi:RND family efflux transporter MFP subunit